MAKKGCLKNCNHVMTVKKKYIHKLKKYTRTTDIDTKLRDLQNTVNNGIKVDYDYWNAVLYSRH
ncbi:MAG: hypothetical protein Q8N37_00565 [bacterium]|nr:hypothetical protein [bacterium]